MSLSNKVAQAHELLAEIAALYRPAAFANSFGAEDMVLTDLICTSRHDIEIFSLDTGLLPSETLELMQEVVARYQVDIRVYSPDQERVEQFVKLHGKDAFYRSVHLRKECCDIRKSQGLRRALENKKAWITGLRRAQSITRRDLSVREHDEMNGLHKFNPLIDWTEEDIWDYIRSREVPYNKLHDMNYPSIGCAPCTRPVAEGEDIRAGRWWWETPGHRECGLHVRRQPA